MATVTTTPMLVPPAFDRRSRASTHLDDCTITQRFWNAVKLDSPPTTPAFPPATFSSIPIDEKVMCAIHVEDTSMTLLDDPIVGFETLDCYSPDRPTFTPIEEYGGAALWQPCPYGEPPTELCAGPAPTLASIRYHDTSVPKSNGRSSPWSAAGKTLRSTRFRKPSVSRPTTSKDVERTSANPNAVLALASAFLDTIVRLARSRTSTSTTIVASDDKGPVMILESEVLINVLEEGKRAGLHGDSIALWEPEAGVLPKLSMPPLDAAVGLVVEGTGPRGAVTTAAAVTPLVSTDGVMARETELDGISELDRERQSNKTKAHEGDSGVLARGRWTASTTGVGWSFEQS